VPAFPVAYFIVGQPGLALSPPKAFFDTMFGFGGTSELGFGGVGMGVGQIVIRFEEALVAVFIANDNQDFFGAFLVFLGACHYASLDEFDGQWAFGSIAHIDDRPVAFVSSSRPLIHARPRAIG